MRLPARIGVGASVGGFSWVCRAVLVKARVVLAYHNVSGLFLQERGYCVVVFSACGLYGGQNGIKVNIGVGRDFLYELGAAEFSDQPGAKMKCRGVCRRRLACKAAAPFVVAVGGGKARLWRVAQLVVNVAVAYAKVGLHHVLAHHCQKLSVPVSPFLFVNHRLLVE